MLFQFLCHVMPLNDRNCCLTVPIVEGCRALDALLETSRIWVFKCSKSNSNTMKHAYNESVNSIASDAVYQGGVSKTLMSS